jgi:hypothetical protein
MEPFSQQSFGHPDRYYSHRGPPEVAAERSYRPVQKSIESLLFEHDPQLEQRVNRAFRQWNNVIRDLLRSEMGLRLSIGQETQAVAVRVESGLPVPFRSIVEQIPPHLWRFLLRLPTLEATVSGLDSIISNYRHLAPPA